MVEQLSTLIEVAIAIAGFTGVALALTNRGEDFNFFEGALEIAHTMGIAATVTLTLASFNMISQSQALYVGLVASLLMLALMHFAYFISRSLNTLTSKE